MSGLLLLCLNIIAFSPLENQKGAAASQTACSVNIGGENRAPIQSLWEVRHPRHKAAREHVIDVMDRKGNRSWL